LQIEALEGRDLPSTWLVVPADQANGVNRFADLQSALDNRALVAGDTIQIEPHASPGARGAIEHPLTLCGDPAFGPGALPQLPQLELFVGGVTLRNLNLSRADIINGATGSTIEECLVQIIDENSGPKSVGSNVIASNIITIALGLGNPDGPAASGDQIVDNVFPNFTVNAPIYVVHENNLVVQGNTLTSQGPNLFAIVVADGQNDVVSDNRIEFSPGGPLCSGIGVGNSDSDASYQLANNSISTASGTAVRVFKHTVAHTVSAVLSGNDLVRNDTGLSIGGDSNGLMPSVDAGGGGSSLGGNDFRGYLPGQPAITISPDPAVGTVQAQFNIWSVADARTVVTPPTNVNVANPLSAQAAFVQRLYSTFLKRTATLGELNGWVPAIASIGQAGVANAIIHSGEADSRLVETLYRKLLDRQADAAGEAGWVGAMVGGLSAEQVIADIMASPEFATRANRLVGTATSAPDSNFVQALYSVLFGRRASGAEVAGWVNVIPQIGRSGIATAFLHSSEFRTDLVDCLYAGLMSFPATTLFRLVPDMLHRGLAPAATETAFWVSSGLDILGLETGLATSLEYFQNG
jgi:hypothetical protein